MEDFTILFVKLNADDSAGDIYPTCLCEIGPSRIKRVFAIIIRLCIEIEF